LLDTDASFTVESNFFVESSPVSSSSLSLKRNAIQLTDVDVLAPVPIASLCISESSDCTTMIACNQTSLLSSRGFINLTISSDPFFKPIFGSNNFYCIFVNTTMTTSDQLPLFFNLTLSFTPRQLDLTKTDLSFTKPTYVFTRQPVLTVDFNDQNGDPFTVTKPIQLTGNCDGGSDADSDVCGFLQGSHQEFLLPEVSFWSIYANRTVYLSDSSSNSPSATCIGSQQSFALSFMIT